MKQRIIGSLAVLLTLLSPVPADAMLVQPMSLEQLVKEAGSIFVGRVEQAQGGRCGPHACTRYTFRVERNLWGAAGERVDAQFFGGGGGMLLPGMPVLLRGGRYLLFLRAPSRLGFTSPVGMSQGVFVLHDYGQGGTQLAVGPTLIGSEGRGRLTVDEERTLRSRNVTLDAFCGIVSRLVRASIGERQRGGVK